MALEDDQDVTMHMQRFMDIGEEPRRMLPPIQGFETMPLVSLEEAVRPLVSLIPDLDHHVSVAKSNCKMPIADGLSIDESASIRLYTMEWKPKEKCLYVVLNKTLRSEDRQELKPWFLYLRLIIGSLLKIPSTSRHVLRGVRLNLSPEHIKGQTLVWWAFTSCTDSVNMLNNKAMFGQTGDRTLFQIDCYSGKDIRQHSAYLMESEILLLPATQLLTVGYFDTGSGMHIIQLKETEPKFPLMNKIPGANANLPIPSHSENPGPIIKPPTCETLPVPEIDKAPIKVLNLSNNNIGDEGVRHLVEVIKRKRTLTALHLNGNQISDEGVKLLANALCHPGTNLQKLYLHNNKRITDSSVDVLINMLKQNQSLKTFWLIECKLTSG
ncbi:unnamed protein product, partial [Rotaria magnacalcarata]